MSVKGPFDDILEPGAKLVASLEAKAAMSIAISLKRIADQIEGDKERYGLVAAISEAIINGIHQARNM